MTEIGTILDGKYEILKMIGKGGMSYVYLAIDNRLNKQWAVKEVRTNGQNVNLLIERLVSETNILKKIDHPVIPRIVDILHENELIYVVMDYVEGRTMAEVLQIQGAQSQETVVEWGKQLADALNYLHSMNPPIIYRDMKPSNVMLKPDGSIKLIDFGTAKEFDVENVADTTALGTRGYAAPEQFGDSRGRGRYNTDARTDIYSLGATLYHMVTGKNPSEPPYEIRPIREWNAELSQGLEKIIQKCTESNPEKRYENCLELLYDLENYDRLDKKYYRKLWRYIGCCFLSFVMTIVFLGLAAYGKYGQRQTLLKEYENVMNEAELAIMSSDYTEALNNLQIAITQIDSTREEAYKEMLNIYSMQNQLEEGLASICKYIDTYEGTKRPPDEIIFEVAKQYFNEQEYKKCFQYASMVEGIEEAKYYEGLAKILSSLYVNETEYATQLDAFEKYNASLTNSKNKMDNYKALAMVYVTQVNNSSSAADKAIKICETVMIMLEDSEGWLDEEEAESFEKVFLEYITKAYEWKKKQAVNEPEKKSCCSRLEEYYQNTIYMLDDDVEEERKTKLLKMLALANVYQEQQKFQEGRKLCEQMEKIYTGEQDDKINIYLEHMQILYAEQAQKSGNVKKWNMTAILELKEKAEEALPDIKLDREWKKIMVSMDLEK